MAIGHQPSKREPDPKEVAEKWAFDTVFPAHQRAADGKTECLFTGVGTLTPEAVKTMVAMLFGAYAPIVWVRSPEGKNMHKGKAAIQAPNREVVKINREGLPNFFGVTTPESDVSEANLKASGQTIQRFLQAFGAAYEYFQADHKKVEDALLNALVAAKTATPNGVLQAAKGKIQEGTDASTVAWGEVLRPKVPNVLERASILVNKVIHTLNQVGTMGAKSDILAVTATDLDRISQALLAAMKRLDAGEIETGREVLENVQEEDFEDVPEPGGAEAI